MRASESGAGRGEAIRSSRKLPLVLQVCHSHKLMTVLMIQHSGHSRLIVGYEETVRGEINLLVLDPGR
jgi:hypothetical protein